MVSFYWLGNFIGILKAEDYSNYVGAGIEISRNWATLTLVVGFKTVMVLVGA